MNPPVTASEIEENALTVIIPAYNEADSIADTIRSLQLQTRAPAAIVVIDDCSTDGTAAIASALGVTVVRPPANTGSKAGAQMFALAGVKTAMVMALDADTTLAPDAIELLLPAFEDPEVVAACGTVLPRRVESIWERGRYIEYLLAFGFFKRVQDYYGKPLISSGCFSIYRTGELCALGGWSTRTMAEDMDLTWTIYGAGGKVRFCPAAVSYPIEPRDFAFMSKQLRRWSHGFVQNVRLHGRSLLGLGFLRSTVAIAFWDAIVASIAYLVLIPVLALAVDPLFFLGYLVDAPVVMVPVLWQAFERREARLALASMPSFFVLRIVNGVFMLRALWDELVVDRPLLVYEKGH
jgi:cellulose synthase/poly-beta-1,6-N-acetylglucosamine synthase-like glycosyltransferase